ncbi:long-chain fatty acid transport protein 2-like [Mytilus trossulus]|uniref:long-chain fatty acid transport protein 2-like n=1 Tax=Mytilus trossulus TaxID=6551 RepID=UPI003004C96E
MFMILATVAGAIGGIYLLVKLKLPWLRSDFKFLKLVIGLGKDLATCKRRNILPIDIFEKTADKFTTKPMIIYKGVSYSFMEVDKMANKLANVALGLGIKQGDTVAMLMYNEPAFVWTWFGFEKIGVEVAFINFHQRKKTLLHSLTIGGAKAIFMNSGIYLYQAIDDIANDLKDIEFYTLEPPNSDIPSRFKSLADDLKTAADQRIPRDKRSSVTMKSTNCLIFTSGTTGLPKPAIVKHTKCIIGGFLYSYCHVTPDDILYECLPLYHSAGCLIGIGTSRKNGVTIVLAEKFSASKFFEECHLNNVTMIHYVGEMCRYLVNSPKSDYDTNHKIRVALGNGLRKDVWTMFQKKFKIDQILEFYGATEMPVGFINIENAVGSVGRVSPLIKRIFRTNFVKFDTDMDQPVRDEKGHCITAAPYEPGLLICSLSEQTPFEGYKNRNEATKRKLIHDVYKKGDIYINSGDLFYHDENHYCYFYDRLGDTYRWKGENVSTTQVANIITELPFIIDTCVYGVLVPGSEGRAGMATVNLFDSEKKQPTEDMILQIEQRCINELESYAIPRFLRFTHMLDITSTFKQIKATLKKEGFDPAVVKEPLYYFNTKKQKYCTLDMEIAMAIEKQDIKL